MSSPSETPGQQGKTSGNTKTRTRQAVTVQFEDVTVHTAKCDVCNKRNSRVMVRCLACGWQCCEKCLNARSGGRAHDTFTSTHVPE